MHRADLREAFIHFIRSQSWYFTEAAEEAGIVYLLSLC